MIIHGQRCSAFISLISSMAGYAAWTPQSCAQPMAAATWELLKTKKGEPIYNIFVRGNRGWAVGNKGTYLLSRDGGMTWGKQDETIKSKLLLADVVFSSQDKGWIVGAAGTILKTTDAGESWSFCSGLSYIFEGFKMPAGLEKNIIE